MKWFFFSILWVSLCLSVAVCIATQNHSTSVLLLWTGGYCCRLSLQTVKKKKKIQEVAASPDVATEIWMDVAAAAALFYSELNGVFTLMRTLWNSEGFLGGKYVFHFTPCRLWQVFSETLRLCFCAVMSNLSTLATKCCWLIRLVVKKRRLVRLNVMENVCPTNRLALPNVSQQMHRSNKSCRVGNFPPGLLGNRCRL